MTEEQYEILRDRMDREAEWIDSQRPQLKCANCGGTGRIVYWLKGRKETWENKPCTKCTGNGFVLGPAFFQAEDMPPDMRTTPAERSAVQVHEFLRDKPRRYIAHVNEDLRQISTWIGQPLGKIVWHGGQNLRIEAINGLIYSAVRQGARCHMKAFKPKEQTV